MAPFIAAGALHAVLPMADASQVGDARRQAQRLAVHVGLDDVAAGRLALIVTELGNNLVRHAQGGRLLLAAGQDAALDGVEIISLDAGPGMRSIEACLRDGFSTGGTPGTGLGAVKRLADVFEHHTAAGRGSVLLARVLRSPADTGRAPDADGAAFECAGVAITAPGEIVSGDGWLFHQDGDQAVLMLADGLGHGEGAAEASRAALQVLASAPFEPLVRVLERAHAVLRSTRGAAVALARLDAAAGRVSFAGAGNVLARLVSGTEDRTLLSQHGTLGVALPRLQVVEMPWPDHAWLVMTSDGLSTRWTLPPGALQMAPPLLAASLLHVHVRGRDDATAVVVRRRDGRRATRPGGAA